jgi:hypothetical protein
MYIQRGLMKAIEGIMVKYGGAVRNSLGMPFILV